MKRAFSLAALLLLLPFLFGCSSRGNTSTTSAHTVKDRVTLDYYTIGNPDSGLQAVNEELNRMLAEKIGIQVNYHKVPWSEYGEYITKLISSGSNFDITFATTVTQGDFLGNARRGAWLALDDYLTGTCKETYDAINPSFWEGVRVDGSIYGIPTNKELAVPNCWIYPEELVKKYDIDISKYTTLESLEPLFEFIHENEPDYTVMDLTSDGSNYFAQNNYEYILEAKVPLMVRSDDKDLKLVNIFETEFGKDILRTLHRYYKAGYINADAALTGDQSLEYGKNVFWLAASGGPYSESTWSKERGYPLVSQQVTTPYINMESVRGGIMVINSHTNYPEESAAFLNCLNTDPDVRNLVNYGIEGINYRLTEEDQVEMIDASYMGVQYTQGNWFILKTVVGDPLDKWEVYKEFNEKAVPSETLGFTPSVSDAASTKRIQDIRAVVNKYSSPLMTGTVNPDLVLPDFLKDLEDAGINQLKATLQKQLDAWKAQK